MKSLLILSIIAASADFTPRVGVLETHLERLNAIPVSAELQEEKDRKIEEIKASLEEEVSAEEKFNEIYHAMDEVRAWLWENASNRPQGIPGEFSETDEGWRVETPDLKLLLLKEDLSVAFEAGDAKWRMAPCSEDDLRIDGKKTGLRTAKSLEVEEFNTGFSRGLLATFAEFPEAGDLKIYCSIHLSGNEALFEIAAEEKGANLGEVRWPKAIEFGNENPEDCSVIPFMQGMLLPADWPQKLNYEGGACNSRFLYMPWWGQIRKGHGLQTIFETEDDAGAVYTHPDGGPTRVQPVWYPSLGSMRYARRIRYVFEDSSTYVTQAKRYRRYVQETGHFVSLKEKVARNPAVSEVIGRPVVHLGSLYHFVPEASLFNKKRIEANHALALLVDLASGLEKLKANGIEDAYIHLDGWGFYGYDNGHPDVLPPGYEQGGWEGLRHFADTCEKLGYLFAVHDQYRDFYFNAVSFDDRLVATRADGSREEHSTWCGGPQTILSPRFAPGYVRRNHDLFAANGVKVRGAYLDVFAVVPLEESFQPPHPMSRSECAEFRKNCFDLLRARGYVVSSEEPVDYAVPFLDLVHHGPYGTYPNIGGGEATGIPVPLFNLVYHDAILLPWEMGEDGGWGVPKGDAARLHCLLNAGLPYVSPGASEEQIERVKEAATLAQRCGMMEMTNHEFLDESRRKQKTTFEDGTTVTVDFETKEYSIVFSNSKPTQPPVPEERR